MSRPLSRLAIVAIVGTATLWPGVARADAPGPTDYRSRVVSVDPPTPTIHPSIIAGDSFLSLEVDAGIEVSVPGYRGEPFLKFEADRRVLENRASSTYAVSKSRYGSSLPAGFDESATPQWHQVASNGTYAWHDHRIHWMADVRPPGKRPGDVVLRERIPMTVGGTEVKVTVESVWIAAPSRVPVWLGAGLGLAVALVAGLARRSRFALLPLVDLAVLATVVGWWQYASFPSETGPQLVWLLLPAVAAATATVAAGLAMTRGSALTRAALTMLTGVNLAIWGWMRREHFIRSVLATNAPGWLDRFASAAALANGPVVAAFGVALLALAVAAPQRLTSAS